ncbi:methionyl-tRNA formyltransferase [Candidatus Kaiserbacteria bacterium RIFCSPHIGHO2_01_FULL_46_22]|uniref:Methionyl-tRNA formyltransferase n=1 Tax=Candidatus Kaiserbacteria bacterium RIFCSPHIGHO2_01_FULL_46_22 TaxID=1798475 RepID=A0A1F6BYC1_9BACT|nr:MAG: methionyl-tRNA formyltransferase [Candidatus Kaiserbacteria bacterium RIFCSPHIGHO2_01_FULL_46_22]
MKFVFFGTPNVASETLAHLLKNNLIPSLVVTNPDRPRGRGQQLSSSPVKELALAHHLPVITPDRLDEEFLATVKAVDADYAVVVAYGKIFSEELINLFPKGVVNVHYSLLPKYRGAAPLEAALLNDDEETGVTLQKMTKELDAGDIIAAISMPIKSDDTALSLRPQMITLGAELLVSSLLRYFGGELETYPQDHTSATFAPKRSKADGELDLSLSGQENWRKFRAFNDSIGTYFFKDGKRYKVTSAHLNENGQFIIERVIPEGKNEMEYKVN